MKITKATSTEAKPLFMAGSESSCCGTSAEGAAPRREGEPSPEARWITGRIVTGAGVVPVVSTRLTARDHWEHVKARSGSFRMEYSLEPGLYAAGSPGSESDVFASANYRMSFNRLREALDGMNAWILVLDTAGINVWCAAGKGTFGTEELVKRIISAGLDKVVSHRRVIVPQLGAPGIRAAAVKKWTGFSVSFGPVKACDIGQYVKNGYHADAHMRIVRFGMIERLVLTPIELNPAVKKLPVYLLVIGVLFGLMPHGVIFREAVKDGLPAALGLVLAVMAGAFLTPVFLPFIPFRSFALKGWISGFAVISAAGWFSGILAGSNVWLAASALVFFPVVSSFLALQFTGATTFTSMSGVEREVKRSLPVYRAALVLTAALFVVYKLQMWGII